MRLTDRARDLDRTSGTVLATVLVGAVVLGFMLRTQPGSFTFYALTVTLAVVWAGGALASGTVRIGRLRDARSLSGSFVLGLGLVAVFTLGGLVVREIDPLADAVARVVSFTGDGVGPGLLLVTVVTGVAEELFFRGPLYDVIPRHQVAITAAVYTVATLATGNVMLAFAAALLGVVTGLQRRATHGVLAPAITHVTWSVGMLFVLPALFS